MPSKAFFDNSIWNLYQSLLETLGPSGWWPADSPFEVMVGAILTQNTSWQNVEKALSELKANKLLSAHSMQRTNEEELAKLIRSSGYYKQKAKKLKALLAWFSQYKFSVKNIQQKFPTNARDDMLRTELLSVYGIGPETADSILCYALGYPYFVVDTYTKRLWERLELSSLRKRNASFSYEALQRQVHLAFESNPANKDKTKPQLLSKELTKHYNEFHALIVRHGNSMCKKQNPMCRDCPLQKQCAYPPLH